MNEEIISPLTEDDLKGAAYLCLGAGALTDIDQFPPGSGELFRRMHRERRRRFEGAQAMMKEGVTSLLKLGLSYKDCTWAASKAHLAKDKEGWLTRFQTAESELQKAQNA